MPAEAGVMIIDTLLRSTSSWSQIKLFAEHATGFSNDVLHILLGVLLQILFAVLLRTSLRSPGPWTIVLVLELGNEWNDLRVERWPVPEMQWGEGAKDLLLTMGIPTLLLLLTRYVPGLFGSTHYREP